MEKNAAQRPIGERLAGLSTRYPVDENLTLGLDVGIASVGSAVVRSGANSALCAYPRLTDSPSDA